MKRFLTFLLVGIFLVSCSPYSQTTPAAAGGKSPTSKINTVSRTNYTSTKKPTETATLLPRQWWQDAVFYEIFVRSFFDTNGDGIGDLKGVIQKLDYLKSLGISALWLMPIYPSPSYHGYDVTDYYNVNPQYGTLEDLKNLLSEAHKRGMHVILDLVLNHTSNQNPWFVSSNNDIQSPYRNWYIWSTTNPGYLGPMGVAWQPGKFGYYYGIFGSNMPDLNYRNPDVTAEMHKVVKFWLSDIGVDGFRLDAINYLIEEDQKQVNTLSTHEWLKDFYTTYKADNPIAFTVGEVNRSDASLASTYTGNQMDMVFDFELASSFISSANGQTNTAINSALTFAKQDLANWQFGTFLTNHDQVRTMSVLNGNIDKAKVAAFLLLTSPGTPFIFYGEEIGMEGEKPDPGIRTPMQWSADTNAGFSSRTPWEDLGANYQKANVKAETDDPSSLLSFYREMIMIRNQHPGLRTGDLGLVSTNNSGVFAILREGASENLLVIGNLTESPIKDYSLNLNGVKIGDGIYNLVSLLGPRGGSSLNIKNNAFEDFRPISELPAYSELIYQISP